MTDHEPRLSRPDEWGPVSIVCGCTWRTRRESAFEAMRAHTTHAQQRTPLPDEWVRVCSPL